jgi:hypothetical protein
MALPRVGVPHSAQRAAERVRRRCPAHSIPRDGARGRSAQDCFHIFLAGRMHSGQLETAKLYSATLPHIPFGSPPAPDPVFFASSGKKGGEEGRDWRFESLSAAVEFARSNNLLGVLENAEVLVRQIRSERDTVVDLAVCVCLEHGAIARSSGSGRRTADRRIRRCGHHFAFR